MPIITMEMLYNKMLDVEKMIVKILEREIENNIEEISLNKAAKRLHKGRTTILQEVEDGYLKAIKYRDGKGNIRYRFRVCDIYEYQKCKRELPEKPIIPIRPTQEILRDIVRSFHMK